MAAPAIAAMALNIGKKLVVSAKVFQKGVSQGLKTSGDRTARSAEKINNFQKGINKENKTQDRNEKKRVNDEQRNASESQRESKRVVGPVASLVNNVIKKPLKALWELVLGWAVLNLPKIIKAVQIFIKKIRVFVGSVNGAIRATGGVFQGLIKITGAFLQNIAEFDFADKSGRIAKANQEMLLEVDKLGDSFDDMKNVWNKEEEELDLMLKRMDEEKLARDTVNNNLVEPQDTATGRPRTGGSVGGDLFDVIASGEGDYNSINRGNAGDTPGGAKSVFGKDLTDMTVGEIMSLQQQKKLFAVGKYQIIPSTMKEFVRDTDVKPSDKFDARTQEKFKGYVIDVKRPEVGRYIRGESDDRTAAAQGLAREFASVGAARSETISGFSPASRGDTLYGGQGNNKASISPAEIESALDAEREKTMSGGTNRIPEGLSNAESVQSPYDGGTQANPPKGNARAAALGEAAVSLKKQKMSTSRYGRNGCVYAVNMVYRKAGLTPPWGSSVYVPNARKRMISAGYRKVSISQARAGDIVLMADTHPTEPWVHIGVVGSRGTVIHNSSTNQAFTNEETFQSLAQRYVKIEVFRMPTQVASATSISKNTSGTTATSETLASNRTNDGGQTRTRTKTIVVSQDTYVKVA